MKTREAIYSKEAAELLRIITTYKALSAAQVYRLFPGREKKTEAILAHLIRQGRVFYSPDSDIVSASLESGNSPDANMIAAFWVLLDFLDKAEYHTTSDFPVKISFFSDGVMYDIIRVTPGQEALVVCAIDKEECADPPRRLIIVDDINMTAGISIPNTAGFCTVSSDGAVDYYKQQ